MAVHFKFRSAVAYDSISLDDLFISVRNLKQRIVEHKNLASNRTIDFDLVITDSQTGEEYRDENYLVPRNTSVIIKRVPAIRSKPVIQVDQPKTAATPAVSLPPTKSEAEPDDFGMDLFAAPAPVASAKADEDAKIVEMVSKSTLEWQRFDTPPFMHRGGGKGRGRGSGPPAGYVCHRCGQPGHFIQQCPTNGDPNYDIKKVRLPVGIPRTRLRLDQEGSYVLPDGSVAMMQPDDNLFAKEANALLSVKPTEVPSELRCPLCRSTFKDAVMIPCCQYSFCDKCIRQSLMVKAQCPQCGSTRFKNDDLLPNIALRQAIEKFMQSQMITTTTGDQGALVPDGDSTAQHVIALSESKHSADDNAEAGKTREASSGVVNAEISLASKTDANLHPVIPKDASGSVNQEGNEPVRDLGDGGKPSEPFFHKGTDEIALESEVSKGKKKKKRARGMNSVEGGGMDAGAGGKGERFCYQCGEAGHLAKDCAENVGAYPPHPGVFPPGGPFPMGPYGPDMFWHGPPVPPFVSGYGDGIYGPGLGGMPPPGAYQIPPCVPPPYASIPPMPWFGDHPGLMGGEMPLSREDFLKLQEQNRRNRNEHRNEWSQSNTRGRSPPQDSRHGRPPESRDRDRVERHGSSHRKSEADYDSRNYDRSSKHDYENARRYPDEHHHKQERRDNNHRNERRDEQHHRDERRDEHHRDERRSKVSSRSPPPPPPSRHRSLERDDKREPSKLSEKTSKASESARSKHREPDYNSSDEKRKEERKRRSRSSRERESEEERIRSYKQHDDRKSRDERSSKSYQPSKEVQDRRHSDDHHRQSEDSRSSSRHHQQASDDLARWRPDHYEDERYRHNSSSSRHHHRR